ncbi:UNVERIFIED_CONTAM: putative GPI-anchored protein [Sesamum radiatum]|uniref:GPI-anchored protein n=1 Tax=Sesamum radiatum TaxID=300843 RepID=A0AAW2SLK8_SESRA
MASLQQLLLLSLLFHSLLIIKCDDKEDNLLQGINQYRASLNLTALTKNDRAGCLADEIADQFKNQPCTNTTGSNTVPGTEPQYSDYPKLLAKCHLNVTTTRDGQIMPACVPNLDSGLVLSNFTKSQYSGYLNGTQYTGIGVGSEDNWIVVVLTTSTPEGDYSPGSNTDNGAASLTTVSHIVFLFISFLLLL